MHLHLAGLQPLEIQQVVHQGKDMIRGTFHVLQIILLTLVWMAA